MNKQHELDAVKQRILDERVTPELAATATQLVFGEGSSVAQIVFIGEAPGKNEDLQGKPFVGAAGKFLNEMLATIGMKREDIYITNIVKYRPPENRDPLPEEKKAFLPYLQAQLEVIRPLVVATLGRHSLSCFLPDLQIGKVHGEPKRIRLQLHATPGTAFKPNSETLTLIILPLFHPAAALYNGSMRETLIEDFSRIPAVLEQANHQPRN
jgi:uracil-DNA glycosylase family 4